MHHGAEHQRLPGGNAVTEPRGRGRGPRGSHVRPAHPGESPFPPGCRASEAGHGPQGPPSVPESPGGLGLPDPNSMRQEVSGPQRWGGWAGRGQRGCSRAPPPRAQRARGPELAPGTLRATRPGPPDGPTLTFWVDGVDTAIPMPEPGSTERTLYWKTGAHGHRGLRAGRCRPPAPRASCSAEPTGRETRRAPASQPPRGAKTGSAPGTAGQAARPRPHTKECRTCPEARGLTDEGPAVLWSERARAPAHGAVGGCPGRGRQRLASAHGPRPPQTCLAPSRTPQATLTF